MKVVLEFNLPEDQHNFEACSKGMEWALASWDLDQKLRNWLKYGGYEFQSVDEALEGVRKELHEFLENYNLTFDSIL
jgi:hypothetical protein